MATETPPAETDGEAAPRSQKGDSGSPADGTKIILQVLGVVGTSIGILGFVTFFGGAILWVRARGAHLPANEVVAVVPTSVLVTTGAAFLVPAVAYALAAVAFVIAVPLGFRLLAQLRAAKLLIKAVNAKRKVSRQEKRLNDAHRLEKADREALDAAQKVPDAADQLAEREERLQKNTARISTEDEKLKQLRGEVEVLSAEADGADEDRDDAPEATKQRERFERPFELTATLIALTVVPLAIQWATLQRVGVKDALVLCIIAALATAASYSTYIATEKKLLWFGVVAFVSVGIYMGAVTYYRTDKDPKVEPAAALRGARPPVFGLFVAQTTDNVYIGTFSEPVGAGLERSAEPHLVIVPRSQVTDLAVGPLLNPTDARARALALVRAECEQKIEKASSGSKRASTLPACSPDQQKALPLS